MDYHVYLLIPFSPSVYEASVFMYTHIHMYKCRIFMHIYTPKGHVCLCIYIYTYVCVYSIDSVSQENDD